MIVQLKYFSLFNHTIFKHMELFMNFKKLAGTMVIPALLGLTTNVIAQGELNVTNWAEYIGEETIANFEKRI